MTLAAYPAAGSGAVQAGCLFEQVLGDAFAQLPRVVQRLHLDTGARRYLGVGESERGTGLLARLCCFVARLPPGYDGPMCVDMVSSATDEHWIRRFGGHCMPSHLRVYGTGLSEHLGPLRFVFELSVDDAVLHWRVRSVHLFGIALPRDWFAGVGAREFERDGRYRYTVFARLPWVGLLVRYHGWLNVETSQPIPPDALPR